MKILITHVPAGSGHEKAAEAVQMAIREKHPGAEAVLLNGLEGMSPWYQWTFTAGYIGMIHRHPQIWGLLYHLADLRGLAWAAYGLHRLTNGSHGRNLEQIFLRHRPDAIVGAHFFPVEVAAFLKKKGKLRSRIIAVITDYLPHSVWIAPGVDFYVVGCSATRDELIRRGVPGDRIRVTGIPIHPKFKRRHERKPLAEKLGIRPDLFTVLVGSGGFGTGPVAEEISAFRAVPERMQLLIVTGKNSALYQHLENMRESIPHDLKIYRFVDNMDELMDVSDVMVTKPGGVELQRGAGQGPADGPDRGDPRPGVPEREDPTGDGGRCSLHAAGRAPRMHRPTPDLPRNLEEDGASGEGARPSGRLLRRGRTGCPNGPLHRYRTLCTA